MRRFGKRKFARKRKRVSSFRRVSRNRMPTRGLIRSGGNYYSQANRLRPELKTIDNFTYTDSTTLNPKFSYDGAVVKLVYNNQQPGTANTATSGNRIFLNGTTQGAFYNNRIGRKIQMKSLLIRGTMVFTPTVGISSYTYRIIIYYDKQANGSSPLLADLLDGSYSTITTDAPSCPINLNNRDRFLILHDKVGTISAATYSTTYQSTVKPFKIYKKINLDTVYNGTDSLLEASVSTGGLWILLVNPDPSANFSIRLQSFYSRVRFYDT